MSESKQPSRRERREAALKPTDMVPDASRPRLMARASAKRGLPPGSLVYVGKPRCDAVTITVMDYGERDVQTHVVSSAEACREYLGKESVTWINIVGLHEPHIIEQFGNLFGIHPLVLEDIMHTGQRPKLEDHGEHIFFLAKMLYRDKQSGHMTSEQMSVVLGSNYVLTFQEVPQDVFDAVRERIQTATGRIRAAGCDYLAYSLLDALVDNYFVMLEDLDDRIEKLHSRVIEKADTEALQVIHELRREMVFVRKLLWPLRELINGLVTSESVLIAGETKPYLRDVYEHTVQVMDNMDALRDMLTSALEIHLSLVSNRMNEIMRVLTVIATIFIPLTFIAGIYGMNFDHMPELHWPNGYALVWGVMIVVGAGMVAFFRRQKWL